MRFLLISVLIFTGLNTVLSQNIEEESFFDIIAPDHLKGNSSVPNVYYTSTSFENILIARLKHGTDILDGLKEIAEKEGIKNAVILTGIGSVTNYHVHSVDNKTFPSENVFIKRDEPADVTNISGYVIDGKVHAHITLSDEELAMGGHLEPNTNVFTFCIITIGILNDETSLKRFDDKTLR